MRKFREPQRTRRLAVEGLESRTMMATVSAAGGLLFINGNNSAEVITVTQTESGRLAVTQGVGAAATTSTHSAVFGIYADLKGGNDSITLGEENRPLPLLSSVTVRLGDGSDTAQISVNIPGLVFVDGGMQFNGAAQDDTVIVDRSIIGSLMVNTYSGDDELLISRSGILSLFADMSFVAAGAGLRDYDLVDFTASAIGSANISLGNSGASATLGNEVFASGTIFGLLTINGGSGIDEITIDSAGEGFGFWVPSHIVNTAETLEPLLDSLLARLPIGSLLGNLDGLLERLPSLGGLSLPGGIDIGDVLGFIGRLDLDSFDLSDTLEDLLENVDLSFVGDIAVVGSLTVNTGDGADTVDITATGILANATINTGNGADNVNLTGVNVPGALYVWLGSGADNLRMIEVASAIALLDGGAGTDGLLNVNGTGLGRRLRSILSFETPLTLPPFFPT